LFEDEERLAARSAAADRSFNPQTAEENTVSKSASTSSVYRVTEIIGTSERSWEDAAKHAVETAAKALRDLRVAEVNKLDLVIVDGKVTAFRARVNLSFKYEKKD
jgi:flavin-binding protein dodecin